MFSISDKKSTATLVDVSNVVVFGRQKARLDMDRASIKAPNCEIDKHFPFE